MVLLKGSFFLKISLMSVYDYEVKVFLLHYHLLWKLFKTKQEKSLHIAYFIFPVRKLISKLHACIKRVT